MKKYLYIILLCVAHVNAEPRMALTTPNNEKVSAKVNVPAHNTSKVNIPNLPSKNLNENINTESLTIIEKNTSNKPLPLKKLHDVKFNKHKSSHTSLKYSPNNEVEKQNGSLKIIENGQSTFDSLNVTHNIKDNTLTPLEQEKYSSINKSSVNLLLANEKERKNKDIKIDKVPNENISINNLNNDSLLILKEIQKEIISLRQEIQQLKQKNKYN